MSLIPRISIVDKAVLVTVGNSLVICGSNTAPIISTSDLMKIDGTTTRDYTLSGSSALLNILSNSTILYAELVWYSSVFSNVPGATDLRSIQDNPITFTTPKGSYQVTPLYKESYNGTSGTVDRYRAADVTSYIKDSLSGTYSVSNVPTSVPSTGLSNSRAGWSLNVIYRNNLLKPQKVVYSSGVSVATSSTPLQTTITGFTTSTDTDLLKGYATLVSANGGPLSGTEMVYAGPSFAALSNIGNAVNSPSSNPGTAPNNPGNNFFSGVINVANQLDSSNGLININGTRGTLNNDGFIPSQTIGNRNKWDITSVDISNTLIPNQTLLAGQITAGSETDGIQLVALGAQVLAKAPNITATLLSYDIDGDSEYNTEVGEPLAYSIQVKNEGDVDANNVIVSAVINAATSFIPGSVTINGVSYPNYNIANGVNLGTVEAKGIVTLMFEVVIKSVPEGGLLHQDANYSYQFLSGIDTITNSGKTNTIEVIVQEGNLSVVKSVSEANGHINDIVTYTIDIQNTGTETAQSILFQDKLDSYSSFVSGSVTIDGVTFGDLNPVDGFNLNDLIKNDSTEIKFRAKLNSLPPSTKITNIACVSFKYYLNQYVFSNKKTIFSNSTSIQILFSEIIGERCNNNNYPNIGDTVTYNLSLTNIGNLDSSNVQVLEPQVIGASFVSGSVKINGTSYVNLNPFTGFTLPNPIVAGTTTNIQYGVLVNSLDSSNLIENIANVPFKYQISQGSSIISSEIDSNIVDTVANYVCMNIVKAVDKAYASVGDTLYYKVNVTNNGNINAISTVFLDSIQSEASFIAGTVAINGISYSSYNPNIGFTLGTICPGDEFEITFSAKVMSLPNPNIIYNTSSLVYGYLPDPNGSVLNNTIFSNQVQTIINKAQYSIVKSVNKTYAQVGDPLVYTTTITNTGTVPLTNIIFADFINSFLDFYEGTVYINGVNYPNLNPSDSFPIDDLHPQDTATIVFAATIISNPDVGYIPNMSEVTLTYKENPDSPVVTKTVYSNVVKTYDPFANLSITKSVDKAYAGVSDTLTYSFVVSNTGISTALNTFFSDTLQSEASFVQGSVLINGISKPLFNPEVGFTLGDIVRGRVITVEFKVAVNSLPSPNTIKNNAITTYNYYVDPNGQPISKTATSNTVTTIINSYSATLTKAVDKSYAAVGDVLNYTVTATNTGTVNLENVVFSDLVPVGATFLQGSVIINGVSSPSSNPNSGFSITNILPGGASVIQFKATVTSVPNPPQIKNTASLSFNYKLNPTGLYINGSLTSNTTTTNIKTMSLTNTKSVSKSYGTLGDTITYTSVIVNTGTVNAENTMFVDNIPSGLSFVSGTVKINGTSYPSYDPHVGFTLGTILQGNSVTITFDTTVSSMPSSGFVSNTSNIEYQYKIDPNGQYFTSNVSSNSVVTYINYGDLTALKSADRTVVRLTNIINYTVVISNTGNTILKNLNFKDIIQSESSFNIGSVYVNGENKPLFNPNIGFSLSDIPVGGQTIVTFAVTANSIPINNELLNKADITYSYFVDPNGSPTTKTKSSNETTVMVYDTIISSDKTVDKALAKIGDTLNFTVTLNNEGNTVAQNILFKDILDSNISFVTDSVYVNNVQKTGYNPSTGFSLDDITGGGTTTVRFQATVISRPTGNIIYNYATTTYKYTVGIDVIDGTINTNTTETYVAYGELTVTKSENLSYATVSDNIAYTVKVQNTGSVNATNINFKDIIQSDASFVIGSVVVDGISQSGYDPNVGFSLTDLIPNQYHTVTFTIKVDSLPLSGEIQNTANIRFTYKLTPTDTPVTTTTNSNTVITYIKIGNLQATKTVDKAYATIGDTLNYTITINNLGNATCSDIFFKDIVDTNAAFVSGTVKINGTTYPSLNPSTGFNLSDIVGYGSVIVKFAVVVQTLPEDYTIYNKATYDYSYYINPSNPKVISQGTSNTVTTLINVGSLSVTKAVSKAYATIEDVLTYTVTIINTGNTLAKNINFRDVIPQGLTFVEGSVTIDGTSYPSYNPYTSFSLSNLNAGSTVVVRFNASVTSLPAPSLISNTANITFAYKIDPNGQDITIQTNSNTVQTQINLGSLYLTKAVDKAYSTMGTIITYTVTVTNNGNVDASNVLFTDALQSDVTFNPGSVTVNGVSHPDYDPNVGFSLGNLAPLDSVTVVFKVTVIQSPSRSSVINYALGSFFYKVDPNGQDYSKSIQSNTVSTIIIIPSITATKVVNKAYATIQEILNYSILIKNTGNTTISEMEFADFLSNGGTFKTGTVVIDGISYPAFDPIAGFNMPSPLLSGNTSLVEFEVTVTQVPSPPQITNYSVSNGVYYVDPLGASYPITATSNTVTTNINIGTLTNTKTVDKMYARVNDTINYTSTITNTGNVTLTNLYFTDNLQGELGFVGGTVSINGVVYPNYDPTIGFSLSNLGVAQTVTVRFTAKINSLPIPAYVTNISNVNFNYKIDPNGSTINKDQSSNLVTTNVVLGQLNSIKIVDKEIATLNDILTYTITLTNVGNVSDDNVFFQDIPSTGVTFNPGSVTVNGVTQGSYSPITGFSLGSIGIGNVVIVTFTVTVTSVPSSNKVTNNSITTFKYVVDPKEASYTGTSTSNTVTTNIAYGNLSVTKAVNKKYATIGEEITYTITIVNIGNINATNVVFKDPTPRNSIFVIGSVTINGVAYPSYNPSAGFDLNTMTPGQIITVVYKVQVIDLC